MHNGYLVGDGTLMVEFQHNITLFNGITSWGHVTDEEAIASIHEILPQVRSSQLHLQCWTPWKGKTKLFRTAHGTLQFGDFSKAKVSKVVFFISIEGGGCGNLSLKDELG